VLVDQVLLLPSQEVRAVVGGQLAVD